MRPLVPVGSGWFLRKARQTYIKAKTRHDSGFHKTTFEVPTRAEKLLAPL